MLLPFMSCATCTLCGTPLGPRSWTSICGPECLDLHVAAGHATPARRTGQLTLAEALGRGEVLPSRAYGFAAVAEA